MCAVVVQASRRAGLQVIEIKSQVKRVRCGGAIVRASRLCKSLKAFFCICDCKPLVPVTSSVAARRLRNSKSQGGAGLALRENWQFSR